MPWKFSTVNLSPFTVCASCIIILLYIHTGSQFYWCNHLLCRFPDSTPVLAQFIHINRIHRESPDKLYFTQERTIHNKTDVIIGGLMKGTTYVFIICLGNKKGKGSIEESEVITPSTGDCYSTELLHILCT